MERNARSVFDQYCADLEEEPGLWAIRLFDEESGGLVWRNRAHLEHYATKGFYPSPTLPWSGVVKYFTPERLAELNEIYVRASQSVEPIKQRIEFDSGSQRCAEETSFLWVFGDLRHGVLITHAEPCALSSP